MSEKLTLLLYSFAHHLFEILAARADLEIMPSAFICHARKDKDAIAGPLGHSGEH